MDGEYHELQKVAITSTSPDIDWITAELINELEPVYSREVIGGVGAFVVC